MPKPRRTAVLPIFLSLREGVAQILLDGKHKITVSEEDVEFVLRYEWYKYRGYFRCLSPTYSNQQLHRLLATRAGLVGKTVDHKNLDKSDNTRANLRPATQSQNSANQPCRNKIGLKGVRFCKSNGKFEATIQKDNLHRHLGYFDTAEEAHSAYCQAADQLHGDFSNHG